MAERPQLVVDASIAAAALIRTRDEPFTELADRLFSDMRDGRIRLIAPHHIYAEVGHALLRALRRQRISQDEGEQGLDVFYSWEIDTVRHTGVLTGAWRLATRYGCSFYDAGYMALAVMTDTLFLHADKKLHDRIAGQFPYELWVEDYSWPL